MSIYLIGDSIRLAYEPFVRQALSDLRIHAPSENCRSSGDVLQHLRQWTQGIGSSDIVHINCGLHDIRHNEGCHQPLTDLTHYQENLRQIFDYLKSSGATVIWASSTPILESLHNIAKPSRRYLADIQTYNHTAQELAQSYGFAINDLYGLMFTQDLTALMLCDGLHFNEFGSEVLAKQVVDMIRKIL